MNREVIICGWICPDCSEKFKFEENRKLPKNHVQRCENCDLKFIANINGNAILLK